RTGRCDLPAPEREDARPSRARGLFACGLPLLPDLRICAMSAIKATAGTTGTVETNAKTPASSRVIIFDTTLRDGEQSPGASMNLEEKIKIALLLEEMGVDVIEAGFPIASNGDFEAVREIAKQVTDSSVGGPSRGGRADIERCWEAVQHAKRPRIHTFISTSPLHMKFKLQMTPEQVHQAVIDSVTLARKLCDDVEWSCEDGSRSEHDFL